MEPPHLRLHVAEARFELDAENVAVPYALHERVPPPRVARGRKRRLSRHGPVRGESHRQARDQRFVALVSKGCASWMQRQRWLETQQRSELGNPHEARVRSAVRFELR